MSTFKDIPIVVQTGSKFTTPQGFNAIKNGVKAREDAPARERKPEWLRVTIPQGGKYQQLKELVREHKLSTVCEEAMCPNIGECWSAGTATLMLMGSVCTRACRFCAVDTGNPRGWLDEEEPAKAAETVSVMGLKYVVLTSVNRDDLPDGGARHYADTVRAIKARNPETAVEVLTPDFQGDETAIDILLEANVDVFAQNIETVKRLTHPVRDPRASYEQTLDVLEYVKRKRPDVLTKTSLILGLGETDAEIEQTMDDLRAIHVDILTLGQYLRPTLNHLPVDRFVTPAQFNQYRDIGLAKDFLEVVSGPMVRSSYRAERALERNNAGLND